jgi:hypothetical protein
MKKANSPLFEVARVLVRFDHVAVIVDAYYSLIRAAEKREWCARPDASWR